MGKFEIRSEKNNDLLNVKIVGGIDEDAVFPKTDLSGVRRMEVDFQGADSINSCGVREWIKWIETLPPGLQVEYVYCPSILIDQINMVGGLIRKDVRVQSFYTPYFCEACKSQTMLLFRSGKEFVGPKLNLPANVKCSKCQGSVEMDVLEAKYFKFLSRF